MKRHALFVGVNDYADEAFKNLRYSLSDAVALSCAFAARGFDVEVLSNPKAETVLGAVERKAAGLGPGDVFLFFFAGHGFTAPDGSHLLICANDSLAYLRHNRAGIPVNLLEEITNGHGCNRAFLLDACRTDVFAGVANRGAEIRDLALVSLPDAKVHAGTCCVLRSCDRFCPAMEFDDLGHGVFTRAVMDVLDDDSFCSTPFGEKFVAGIRLRMQEILSAHSVVCDQNPCFQTNGEAFFLFDGVAPEEQDDSLLVNRLGTGGREPEDKVRKGIGGKKNAPETITLPSRPFDLFVYLLGQCGRSGDDATSFQRQVSRFEQLVKPVRHRKGDGYSECTVDDPHALERFFNSMPPFASIAKASLAEHFRIALVNWLELNIGSYDKTANALLASLYSCITNTREDK